LLSCTSDNDLITVVCAGTDPSHYTPDQARPRQSLFPPAIYEIIAGEHAGVWPLSQITERARARRESSDGHGGTVVIDPTPTASQQGLNLVSHT
jgi:hypothetical protein